MPLRTSETKEKYFANQAGYENFSVTKNYKEDEERIIQSFEYWYIIANLFPYDKVAE